MILSKNFQALLPLFVITGAFIVIGAVVINLRLLPEEGAKQFHPLENISIQSDMKVLHEPTLQENVFIYAVNDIAQSAINIAQSDARVKQILDEAKEKKPLLRLLPFSPQLWLTGKAELSLTALQAKL